MTVPDITTARLRLRAIGAGDADAVGRIFADPATSRYFATDLSDPGECRAEPTPARRHR